jgi:hypothetical protein
VSMPVDEGCTHHCYEDVVKVALAMSLGHEEGVVLYSTGDGRSGSTLLLGDGSDALPLAESPKTTPHTCIMASVTDRHIATISLLLGLQTDGWTIDLHLHLHRHSFIGVQH